MRWIFSLVADSVTLLRKCCSRKPLSTLDVRNSRNFQSNSHGVMSSINYTLQVGEKGAPRLTLLNELCNPHTFSFINKVTPLENKRILDVGCGIGILSNAFAVCSLPQGRVVGVDVSQAQLKIAEDRSQKENIKNITFLPMAAENIDQLNEKFDVIYFRFTLMHLNDAIEVIKKARSLMHAESILICEEASDIQDLSCNPSAPVFDKWKKAVEKQVELSNSDFTIGKKLIDIISKQQLTPIHSEIAQPVMNTARLKQQLWQGLREISGLLLSSGFCSEQEIEEMIAELKVFANTSTSAVRFFSYIQVAAKKSEAINQSSVRLPGL